MLLHSSENDFNKKVRIVNVKIGNIESLNVGLHDVSTIFNNFEKLFDRYKKWDFSINSKNVTLDL